MATRKPAKSPTAPARKKAQMVRTNIVIDRDLVERVKKRTGASSAREAVQRALEQVASRITVAELRALRDLNPIRPNYDPKDPMAEARADARAVAEERAEYAVDEPAKPARPRK